MEHNKGKSVLEETMTAFDSIFTLEKELQKINTELSERTDYDSSSYMNLIARLNDINDQLAFTNSEPPIVYVEKTLLGLGFNSEDFARKTETFSQGWNMRIELAKILLKNPDILLLDEPTNHLDIESIEWLEDYLKNFRGSILLVSHDRKFLDNITNRTVEIMLGHIHDYKVPYTKYQKKLIEKTEDFIEKFRYKASKSNQVQSRIKSLDKLERIEIDETDNAVLNVKFPPANRSGDIVFKCSELTGGYPQKIVFQNVNIEVHRGDKVALIGKNGEGKTTLMRIIMQQLSPIEGIANIGYNVNIGYFAQNQEDILDKSLSVYETLEKIAVGDIRTKLRDLLAQFLFKGEDIDKKVAVLSGGERARLAMAKLMLEPYNVLTLDEPTNHMDIKSKEILKQALKAFDGTIIIVSHDRDFLEGLVDKMYEFRNGGVREHLGTVRDFLEKRKLENLKELERRFSIKDKEVIIKKNKQESFRINNKEDKKLKNKISTLEIEIEEIEKELSNIEKLLSSPVENDNILELTLKYEEQKKLVDSKVSEWEKLIENI